MRLLRLFRRQKSLPEGSAAERAERLFSGGQNCAQTVLQATTEAVDEQLLEICAAFGTGIGGEQCLCGAVTGGVMALALAGRKKDAGKLVKQFRQRNRVTCCKALSAPYRWMSPEHLANCRRLSVETAEMVEELLRR